MKRYRCPEIAQLAHELTMSPVRHRLRQVAGAARVIELVEPENDYPYPFVCFHITGYRSRQNADDAVLSGKSILSDLAQLMDALTVKSPLPVESASGGLFDAEALSKRFNVSKKTISRWRLRGLAGCTYSFGDGKDRLAFSSRSVELFVSRNLELVLRGASFQLMNRAEKARIVVRARELVASERCSLHAATLRLAEETGRAIETIRYTLRRFDRENPEQALFDKIEQAQEIDEKTVIYQAYVAGDSVGALATRFGKRPAEIRRMLTLARATELAEGPISYIYNELFDALGAEPEIFAEPVAATDDEVPDDVKLTRIPNGVPPYLRDLYRTSLLSREEEASLFRRMNFVLHKAEVARKRLSADVERVGPAEIAEIDAWVQQAGEIKNRIIQSNLRLVVSIAKRHIHGRPSANLFELVSDGNIALMRAAEKFDYARGFRFSTYASWAITRHFARTIPEEIQQQDRFQTGCEELFTITGDQRGVEEAEASVEQARDAIAGVLKSLDPRERVIVQGHFGLSSGRTQTLDEIGRQLGISKERVRQIEQRALRKMRSAMGERGAELLAG